MDDGNFNKSLFLRVLGSHIAKIRKSKGYSQDRLCLEAGFSRGAISKIESGKVEPRISTLALIALTIGVPLRKITEIDLEHLDRTGK